MAMHSADSVNIYILSAECQCSRLMKMGFIHELLQGENCWDGIRFNYDVNYKGLFILRILFHHLSFNMTVTVIVSSDLFSDQNYRAKNEHHQTQDGVLWRTLDTCLCQQIQKKFQVT